MEPFVHTREKDGFVPKPRRVRLSRLIRLAARPSAIPFSLPQGVVYLAHRNLPQRAARYNPGRTRRSPAGDSGDARSRIPSRTTRPSMTRVFATYPMRRTRSHRTLMSRGIPPE